MTMLIQIDMKGGVRGHLRHRHVTTKSFQRVWYLELGKTIDIGLQRVDNNKQ